MMSREEMLFKMSEDPKFFIENAIQRNCPYHGLASLKLTYIQDEMLSNIIENKRSNNEAPRQVGKSTLVAAYLLWYGIFHNNANIFVVNSRREGGVLYNNILSMYRNLPPWLRKICGYGTCNKDVFELDTKSKFIFTSLRSAEITSRGMTIDVMAVDEPFIIGDHVFQSFESGSYYVKDKVIYNGLNINPDNKSNSRYVDHLNDFDFSTRRFTAFDNQSFNMYRFNECKGFLGDEEFKTEVLGAWF